MLAAIHPPSDDGRERKNYLHRGLWQSGGV